MGDARESAGSTTALILAYAREHGGEDAVRWMLAAAGETRSAAELADEHLWSSYAQHCALLEAAALVLGDAHVGRRIGEAALDVKIATAVKPLLRDLGSPAALVRNIPRISGRFNKVSTMDVDVVDERAAVVSYRLDPGYVATRHDCDFVAGTLTRVPVLFGLAPATIAHDECQVRGADRCVYHLRWNARVRRRSRRARARITELEDQVVNLLAREQAVQETIDDLVSPAGLDFVLSGITSRAANAVNAQRFVLAVSPADGLPVAVHHVGFDSEDEAHQLAREISTGGRGDDRVVVVEVASARRRYGWLAALEDRSTYFPEERDLLASYARQAAVALDAATAVEEARQEGASARALLDLSRALARPCTVTQLAGLLADAVLPLVHTDQAYVLWWHPETRGLRFAGMAGVDDDNRDLLLGLDVRDDDTPEFIPTLIDPQPRCYRREHVGGDFFVAAMMDQVGAAELMVVPVVVDDAVAGVIVAAKRDGRATTFTPARLAERLSGLADQAALALQRARLLDQERETVERLRQDEARVTHLAYHDPLTGLANGRLFAEHLAKAVAAARRHDGRLAVLFCDVDRFKSVNDNLGHIAGDRLLQVVATRLRSCIRDADTLARLGGDEFTILLGEVGHVDDVEHVADRVLDALRRPFDVDGRELAASASVGVAVFPDDGDDPDALLKNADAAMYDAKQRGRGSFQRYRAGMNITGGRPFLVESSLRGALERGELAVHYQPVLGAGGAPAAVEALLRWHHPELGEVPPAEFIPVAEESGLILELDAWMLATACAQLRSWDEPQLRDVRLTVNLSPRQIHQPDLPELVAGVLADTGLTAARLEVELTARVPPVRETGALDVLGRLTQLGVGLALDDAGTGSAVFGQLRHLPVRRIKIDRSFVHGLPDGEHDRAVVTALVRFANETGLGATGVGVERPEQAEVLRSWGCDELQGYLFGRPAAAELTRQVLLAASESVSS